MGKRGGTMHVNCTQDGCTAVQGYRYDSQRQGREMMQEPYYRNWKCVRHANPDKYLTLDNPANQVVLIATQVMRTNLKGDIVPLGMFWRKEGQNKVSSGFSSGESHSAHAAGFPEGTRLVVTAYVETPEQAAVAAACDDTTEGGVPVSAS